MKKEPKLKYIVQEVWKVKEAPDDDAYIKYSEFTTKSGAVDRALELAENEEVLTAVIYRAHAVGANETTVDVLAYLKDMENVKDIATPAELVDKATAHIQEGEQN